MLPVFALTVIRAISRRPFDFLKDGASHLPMLEAIKSKNPELARQAFLTALDGWLSRIRDSVFADPGNEKNKAAEVRKA